MKYSLGKKALAVVCAFVVCTMFAVNALAVSKQSVTGEYDTPYGTFYGDLYTGRGTSSASTVASSVCTPTGSSVVPRIYAMDQLLSWRYGTTFDTKDRWGYNSSGVTTDIITVNTTDYVTAYGYHGVYESNGSIIQTAGTQTIKV